MLLNRAFHVSLYLILHIILDEILDAILDVLLYIILDIIAGGFGDPHADPYLDLPRLSPSLLPKFGSTMTSLSIVRGIVQTSCSKAWPPFVYKYTRIGARQSEPLLL